MSAFPAETRAVAILSRIIVLAAAETLAPARSTRSVSRGASYAVTYQLNVYCDHAIGMYRLYTELHRNVLDVFNQYNVQIMTPSYMADPAEPKLVPKDQWFAKPAKSGEVPIQRKMVGEK